MRNILFVLTLLLLALTSRAQMRQIHLDLNSTNNDIQKLSFYSPSSGFIASTDNGPDWVGFTTDSGHNIVKRPITLNNVNFNGYLVNLGTGFSITGVKAFNQDNVIAYGDYGWVPAILYSSNGGVSWLLVYHAQYNNQFHWMEDMAFPQNSPIGYAVDGYRILKTTDGGLSWFTSYADGTKSFDALDGIDNNNLFCFSLFDQGTTSGKLLKTNNAGVSWQPVTLPDPRIYSADFISATRGWINVHHETDGYQVYYTSNSGGTWTKKNDGAASPVVFRKMQFVNDSLGFAIDGSYDTYKTADSGRVWEPFPHNNGFSYLNYGHNDLQVISSGQLWSGGGRDFLEINTNAGGAPLPRAYFKIDTAGVDQTGTVHLLNYSKQNYTYQWTVNSNTVSTAYNTTYTHALASSIDTITLIVFNGTIHDTLVQFQNFSVPNLPAISSFLPAYGSLGSSVTIRGAHLSAVTSVRFGGVNASSFVILNDTTIRATVGAGATGAVSVTDVHGTASHSGFTYFPVPAAAAPVIPSISSPADTAGAMLTINGVNFGATDAENTVFFGTTRATILSATSTQIVCRVPVGSSYASLGVLNTTTHLSGRSPGTFNPIFADSSNFTPTSFTNVYNVEVSPEVWPYYADGADLDGDGRPELVYTKGNPDSLLIRLNTSPGGTVSFGPPVGLPVFTPYNRMPFKFGDLDGDGRVDIITPTNSFRVTVNQNLSAPGSLSFSTPMSFETGGGSQQVSIDDLDNDGRPELAVASYDDSKVSLLRNTSSPGYISFAYKVDLATASTARNVATGDLDLDGKKDIVALNYIDLNTSSLSLFKNNSVPGTLSFTSGTTISLPGPALNAAGLALADYDGDGRLDIIVTNDGYNFILRNTSTPGSISFDSPQSFPIAGHGYAGIVAPLNGDARPDLLFGNYSVAFTSLVRNLSTPGAIQNDNEVRITAPYPWNQNGFTSNGVDFDGDGRIDVVETGSNTHHISILKNTVSGIFPWEPSICQGSTIQKTSDVTGSAYQWQEDTGSGFVNITDNSSFSGTQTATLIINTIPLSWNGRVYRCVVDGGRYSTKWKVPVYTTTPTTVTLTASNTTICYGTTVTFTAHGGFTTPLTSYYWQVNGVQVGSSDSVFTSNTLTNGAQVKCFLYNPCSSAGSVMSNVITMTVNGNLPSVSMSANATSICHNETVTFTATPVNPGATPSYQWQVNGANVGGDNPVFTTSTLPYGAQVQVILTVGPQACGVFQPVTSNLVIMDIHAPVAPSVGIQTPSTTVCAGSPVTFTAFPFNGGSAPAYQWKVNGGNAGSNSNVFTTTSLANNDQVTVTLTSNQGCLSTATATSETLSMTVNAAVTPSVSITGNTVVLNGQAATVSSAITNGGNQPQYIWQDSTAAHGWQNITGASTATYSFTPGVSGDKLRCAIISNADCASPAFVTSNVLVFTVNYPTSVSQVGPAPKGIRSFPNPVHSLLYIDSLKLSDRWTSLQVTTVDGRIVLPAMNISNKVVVPVNVERLAVGEYLVILKRRNGKSALIRFVKL